MYYPVDKNTKNNEIELLNGLYMMTEAYKNKTVNGNRKISFIENIGRRFGMWKSNKKKHLTLDVNRILPGADYKKPDSTAYFSNEKIAVYSGIFGPYDNIIEPVIRPDNVDYFLVTDKDVPKGSLWKKIDPEIILPKDITDNTLKNRYVKMMPHLFLKDYTYSVYIDGNVMLTSDATVFTASLEKFPVAMHRHKNRDCAYEEIEACIIKGKDEKERLEQHMRVLKEHGLPKHFGLLEATVIARKHNDKLCIQLMENWWNEFKSNSRRDQISLADCIWRMGLDIDSAAQLGNNIVKNHHLIILKHTNM